MNPAELMRACLAVLEREGMTPLGITVPLCQTGLAKPDYCVAIVDGPREGESKVVSVDTEGFDELMSSENATSQWGDFMLHTVLGASLNDFDVTQHAKS